MYCLSLAHVVSDSQQKSCDAREILLKSTLILCVCAGSVLQQGSGTNTSSHPAAGAVETDRSEADEHRDQTTALKDRPCPGEQEHKLPIHQEVDHTSDRMQSIDKSDPGALTSHKGPHK